MFYWLELAEHKPELVGLNFGDRPSLARNKLFKTSQEQLEKLIQRALIRAVTGNRW